jgi:transcription elongation GreA/GreB family factor
MSKEIKALLLAELSQLLDERINTTLSEIESVKESRDSDTKSSAGDKYETGREMIQQELNKFQAQLSKFQTLKNDLARIDPSKIHTQVEFGSLVICNQGNYFLSVAFGKVHVQSTDYFCLSMVSPIGQALSGGKVGEQVLFNGKTILIEAIY